MSTRLAVGWRREAVQIRALIQNPPFLSRLVKNAAKINNDDKEAHQRTDLALTI